MWKLLFLFVSVLCLFIKKKQWNASLSLIVDNKQQQSCGRDIDGEEKREQHRRDKNKVKHDERENHERTPWETEKRERWVLTEEGGCLQICLHQIQTPAGVITVQAYTHTHTEMHTQMHSDNPSALAKCCLIQPDLHSTEKANSLPLTVWKTERSSHKWQRFKLLCLCGVCVCACVFVPGGMLTKHSVQLMFLFLWWFFSVRLCMCVYMYWWWQALQQYPLHCDRQIAGLFCSLLFGGCHQTLLVQPVILPVCVCLLMGECETQSLHFSFCHFYISAYAYNWTRFPVC